VLPASSWSRLNDGDRLWLGGSGRGHLRLGHHRGWGGVAMKHYCRNPRCKMKLAEPVDNERQAFCTPGCQTTFYRNRCVVCEKGLPDGRADRKLCKRASCRNEYRRFPHLFAFAGRKPALPTGRVEIASKTSIKSGSFWCDKSGRGWRWEQYGDEHWLFDRDGDVEARLILIGDRYIVRLTPGIDYRTPSPLDDAKRLAISLALGRLPLEPKYAERLARLNELPPDPPQNLVPWTASYLAGLANVEHAHRCAPSIVPDDIRSDDLNIPDFLRRPTKAEVV
jgi:nuclear transport factor 2 (NTF2) superfamily protein